MRTVVTWKRFADTRPPKSDEYLVICNSGWLTTLTYDKEHDAFCWSEDLQHGIEVAYWAEQGASKTLADEVRQEHINSLR